MNLFASEGLYSNETEAAINTYHNARDPDELPYTTNPNLWCASLLPQLTCCVIHKDDCGTGEGGAGAAWRARYGGVAITKRHILGCAHAYTHAQGTWNGQTGSTPPTRIRFIDANGAAIDRVLLHQAESLYGGPRPSNGNGTNYSDLHVGVLDADLPSSVYIPKVAPSRRLNELQPYSCVILSQEWQPQSEVNITAVGSNYPLHNRQMFWSRPNINSEFAYWYYSGDSGSPMLYKLANELVVGGVFSGNEADQHSPATMTWPQRLNLLIAEADANAIALGRMATPTGYTVTPYSGEIL